MKIFNFRKRKNKSYWFLSLAAVATTSVLLSSCAAQPSESNIKNLFTPANVFFDNGFELNNNEVVSQVLNQDEAFKAFLDSVMGNVLLNFYKNNPIKDLADKYDDWVEEVDKSWNSEVQSYRDQHRNNYLLNLQTDLLDSNGGTEASWKQNELAKKALSEFQNSIFQTDYLHYTDDKGDVVTTPNKDELFNSSNWTKLKYTNQHNQVTYISNPSGPLDHIANNNQLFSQIQDYMSTEWVKQENPNLLSRVVLTNETPKLGFASIFNDKLDTGASASYEFQVFNPYYTNANGQIDPTTKSAAGLWKELTDGTNGLNKFLNTSNNTIDFDSNLSMDSGGKLLMSAYDMFDSYDSLFTAAYVNQYLNLSIKDYATTNLGDAQEIKSEENIMNTFIRKATNNEKESMYTTLDYLTQKDSDDTRSLFASNANTIFNGEYKNYTNLESSTTSDQTKIFDVAIQKLRDDQKDTSSTTTPVDQFLISRGSDGIHILGIDGGKYYITQTTLNSTDTDAVITIRDIEKQKQFLLFRSLYKTLGYNDANKDYSFNATTQIQTLFNKNPSLYIYKALEKDLENNNGWLSLSSNANLKSAFQNVHDKIKDYVNAMQKNELLTQIETAVTNLREKFASNADKYVENDKESKSYANGIAGRIPNVQAADGSIPSLEFYYQNLALENGIKTTNDETQQPFADQTTNFTNGTKSYFNELRNNLNKEISKSASDLVSSLNLTSQEAPTYSQVVLLKANADDSFSLPINLALNSGIGTSGITNFVKSKYFQNNTLFNNFYDFATGKIKTSGTSFDSIATKIQEVTNYYYAESILNASTTSRYSYGVVNTKTNGSTTPPNNDNIAKFTNYQEIIKNVISSQNLVGNQNSDQAIKYFTYLYTFEWLIRDNLQNLKTILNSQIQAGTSALVSWTVPVAVNSTLTDLDTTNPIETFPDNPNYYWGTSTNWMNSVNTPAKVDKSNNLSTPYNATFTSTTTNGSTTYSNVKYGFVGLSVQGDKKVNEALENVLYKDFAKSPEVTSSSSDSNNISTGALYAYGSSRENVVSYIQNNLQTNRNLNTFISFLIQNVGVSITDEKLSENNTNVQEKQQALIALINDTSKIPDKAFNRYTGYIGSKKSTKLSESVPILSTDSTQLLPTYMSQVNNDDVKNLGEGWMVTDTTRTDNSKRLGLSIDEFLAVVAIQALDSGTQSSAITNLINTNVRANGTQGTVSVGDKRLLDALTSRWSSPINN